MIMTMSMVMVVCVLVGCLASELIEMAFPDSEAKRERYGVPQDW